MDILVKWECDRCGELHDDEDGAVDCCRPTVHEVYVCPICKMASQNEPSVIACRDAHAADEVEDAAPLDYIIPGMILDPNQYIAQFCKLNGLIP